MKLPNLPRYISESGMYIHVHMVIKSLRYFGIKLSGSAKSFGIMVCVCLISGQSLCFEEA